MLAPTRSLNNHFPVASLICENPSAPGRRRSVSRNGIAADHVERHRILLVSGLCRTDTHALFVDESHSFPRGLPGLLALELISNRSEWSQRGSAGKMRTCPAPASSAAPGYANAQPPTP